MRITFTTEAVHKLQLLLKDKKLKFLHDIEGCGCVVSGVPTLTTIDSPTEDDRAGKQIHFLFIMSQGIRCIMKII